MTITNITPEAYLCGMTAACPAVYATDRGTLIVIGKRPANGHWIYQKVGDEEAVVEIPRGLVAGIGGQKGEI